MKEKEKGLTLIKLILFVFIVLLLIIFLLKYYYVLLGKFEIIYKICTHQINLEEQLQENEKILGTTDVTGEGIIINILDGKDLIHQEDLIILIDELKNSGSQAISINEQRIVNSTYMYCDGAVILIDGVKIGNPFTIKAIGNNEVIYGAITRNKGYLELLKKDGLIVNIEKKENISILKTNKKELYGFKNKRSNLEKLFESNQLTGKTDMFGKGIEIVIHENSAKLTALSFLQIINDLNSAEVRAISINNERITNMTDIMDISNKFVLLNSIPINSPYVIDVIGNQNKIEEVLFFNNSYITKIMNSGNNVDIYRKNYLKVEKYSQKRDSNKLLVNYLE